MEALGAWKVLAMVACKRVMPFLLVSCLLISVLRVVFMSFFLLSPVAQTEKINFTPHVFVSMKRASKIYANQLW